MNAYLFDVDGVLSGLKREVNPDLIVKISQILLDGAMLGLISGRGLKWQIENVVKPIEEYLTKQATDKNVIDNLFVSGEFGGVSISHKNGKRITNVDASVTLPPELRQNIIDSISEYDEILFAEVDKQTMMSTPSKKHVAEEAFAQRKHEIIARFKEFVQNYPEFEIHADRFSINVKHKKATKRYATSEVIEWLESKNVTPEHYYAFGDSISDLDIGEELYSRNLPMEFVFVGRAEELEGHKVQFPWVVTDEDFDLGTLEYFSKKFL